MTTKATIRAVKKGDKFHRAVEGGTHLTPAPGPGVVVETPEQDIFIAVAEVEAALAKVKGR